MLRRVPPDELVEEPRLRAVTPAYRKQALRRVGTGFKPVGLHLFVSREGRDPVGKQVFGTFQLFRQPSANEAFFTRDSLWPKTFFIGWP
jgi:hypothetical protein